MPLRPAHEWTCQCGSLNFCSGDICEITPDEREYMIESGVCPQHARTGEWLTAPEEVTCASCGETFAVEEGIWPRSTRASWFQSDNQLPPKDVNVLALDRIGEMHVLRGDAYGFSDGDFPYWLPLPEHPPEE